MILNSIDWEQQRLGKFTASEMGKLMKEARSGGGISETGKSYVIQVAAEILTGQAKEIYAKAFDWGRDHEFEAYMAYCDHQKKYANIEYFGVSSGGQEDKQCFLPIGDFAGASPDFLCDIYGEIKCPDKSENHIKHMMVKTGEDLKKANSDYYWQVQTGMLASEMDVCHFVSYDPRMIDPKHKIHVAEIYANKQDQQKILERITMACELLHDIIQNL